MLTPDETRNLQTVEALWHSIEAPDSRDLSKFQALLHKDHVWTSDTVRLDTVPFDTMLLPGFALLGGRVELTGPIEGRVLMQLYVTAFPDLAFDQLFHIVQGEWVASRWHATGTQDGEFMGIPPTHRKGDIHGVSLYQVRDGRIVRSETYWDVSAILRQLGWEGWSLPTGLEPPKRPQISVADMPPVQEELDDVLAKLGVLSPPPSAPPSWRSTEEVHMEENSEATTDSDTRWRLQLGQDVDRIAAGLPPEADPLGFQRITFDEQYRHQGWTAVMYAGTMVPTGEKDIHWVPERTLQILTALDIPYRVVPQLQRQQ